MPETRLQKFIFTLLMAFFMVSFMASYNAVLRLGFCSAAAKLAALRGLKEYPCAVLVAFFLGSVMAGGLAQEYCPRDKRKYFPIFVSFFTPLVMVPMMTILVAVINGFLDLPLRGLLKNMAFNYAFAWPVQLILAGPAVRRIFNKIKEKWF